MLNFLFPGRAPREVKVVALPLSLPLVLTEIKVELKRIADHMTNEASAQAKLDVLAQQLDQVQKELARFQPPAS